MTIKNFKCQPVSFLYDLENYLFSGTSDGISGISGISFVVSGSDSGITC
jgi:hypothetical protein